MAPRNKLNKLKKLYEVVCETPDSDFNQNLWIRKKPDGCGTVGCTLGRAALSGKFPGLTYRFFYDDGRAGEILYKGFSGHSAGERAFGIGSLEASFLFMPYRKALGRVGKAASMARVAWLAEGHSYKEWQELSGDTRTKLYQKQLSKLNKLAEEETGNGRSVKRPARKAV